ncbi:hypothetical protein WDU94_008147 [Cyamophila willieti]
MLDLAIKLKDAATVIAPLLKDYKEAAPVTQLSSPEVDYDVGIADETEDLDKPKDIVDNGNDFKEPSDIVKGEMNVNNTCHSMENNGIDLNNVCDTVKVKETNPCDSVNNENKDCDNVKNNEKDFNETYVTVKDGKTDPTNVCDTLKPKEENTTSSRRDSEVSQTVPSELKHNTSETRADLSPIEQSNSKENLMSLKDVASVPIKDDKETVNNSKECAGISKETVPVKSRQSILKEIGSQEYGDLVYSSNRKVRKSVKGIPRKKLPSITSSGGGPELDSDTASNMSEVDSLSAMTLSQTSSNSEFEYARVETVHCTMATNEDLESQVAKILSLEDVLVNPPPLKTTLVPPEEDHSQLKLNFVDYSLSNASSTSDLTAHSSTSTQSTIPASEPVVNIIEFGKNVVLNFNNEHFGESTEPKRTSPSDTNSPIRDTISQTHTSQSVESTPDTTSRTFNSTTDNNTDHVDSSIEKTNLAYQEAVKESLNDAKIEQHSDIKSPENEKLKSSENIEPVIKNIATFFGSTIDPSDHTIERLNSPTKSKLVGSVTNVETHSTYDSEPMIFRSNQHINIPKEALVISRRPQSNNGIQYHSNFDDISDSEVTQDVSHTSLDSVNKNLPDLLTSVESSNTGSNEQLHAESKVITTDSDSKGSNMKDCDCKNEESTDKHKGYLSTLDQGWQSSPTPYPCVWLGVSCHKIYCGGPRLSVYEADLRKSSLEWNLMSQKATSMMVSPDNRFMWRSNLGVVSTLMPSSDNEWKLSARDIDSVSLNQSEVWYIAQGRIYTQILPYSSHTLVPCTGHTIVKVVSCESRVWVLSDAGILLERDNVSADNPTGDSWSQVITPSDVQISDISLTHSRLGWLVDRSNFIYFYLPFTGSCSSPQVGDWLLTAAPLDRNPTTKEPSMRGEWWQLLIDGNFSHDSLHTASAQKPCIRSNRRSLWITHPLASVVFVNTSTVWGYKWSPLELVRGDSVCEQLTATTVGLGCPRVKTPGSPPAVKWKRITAEGLFEDDGYIWLLSSEGKIYNYDPYRKALTEVPCPVEDNEEDSVVSIESSMNALWVLTEKSQIYIRLGISTLNPTGLKWKKLPLEQFDSENIKVGDLSCACGTVWVCSTRGNVYMTLIPLDEDREQIPAWIPAEGAALPGCSFSRIFIGPHANMVWALDNKSNVYVREGIYHDYQLGVNWLFVPGLQATHLTISHSGVWALSRDTVHQRVGVSPTNFIGAYWQRVPGRVSLLSSSLDDQLYGARNEVALRLRSVQVSVKQEGGEDGQSGGGEWEII